MGHALSATVVTALLVIVLVVAGWATAEDPASSWRGAVGVGAALWLLGQMTDIAVGQPAIQGGSGLHAVTLGPLGITILVVALHARSGRRLAKLRDVWRAGQGALGVGLAAGAVTAAAVGFVVAALAGGSAVAVSPAAAALATGGTFAVAATAGSLGWSVGRSVSGVPPWWRATLGRCIPAAGVALAAWLATAALIVTAGLVVRLAPIADAQLALAAGGAGGLFLVVLQAAVLPNVVVWCGSLVAGPGLTIADARITPSGTTMSITPDLPLLAIAPAAGPHPLWAWAGVLAVVAAGGLAGWNAHRRSAAVDATITARLQDGVVIGLLAGFAAGAISMAATGAVGAWGPVRIDPLLLAGVMAVEVTVGATAVGVACRLVTRRAARTR